jgi:hypothetical protein
VRKIILLTFFIGSIILLKAQSKFEITELQDSETNIKNIENSFLKKNPLFDDNNFTVTGTCSGEWGGTIRFTDKKTKKEFVAEATCPISVDKLNGNYYVTSSLAHMRGFTEIIRIKDPKEMDIFKAKKPKKVNGKKYIYVGDNESHSKTGTTQILDSIGILTLAVFPFENEFYYITTDFISTNICKIRDKKFVMAATLPINDVWSYDQQIIKTNNNHTILIFNNQIKGYLDIFQNKIKIVTVEKDSIIKTN